MPLKLKLILLGIFFILVLILANMGTNREIEKLQSSPQSVPFKSKKEQLNWREGVKYYYAKNPEIHAACKDVNTTCITPERYKLACESANGISEAGGFIAAMSGGIDYLYRNGSIEDITIQWRPEYATHKKCRVIITVSGIVNGNSQRKQADVGADEFSLNNKGELLIQRADNYQ